jgi:hypothetical protein
MKLNCRLTNNGHVLEFSVTQECPGWLVREEEDAVVLRRKHHNDWHLVELDVRLFRLKIRDLKERGWVEVEERAAFATG